MSLSSLARLFPLRTSLISCGLLTLGILVACTTTGSANGSACGNLSDANTSLDSEEQAFLAALNAHRTANNLPTVAACRSLSRAAQLHSEDMRDQDYFSHFGKNGSSFSERSCSACFELACNGSTSMGENIAAGNSGGQDTFEQWKVSAGHNANMLGPGYTHVGIGRATGGGKFTNYWTTIFAGRGEASCQ